MTTSEAEKYCNWIEQKKIGTYIIDNYSLDDVGWQIKKMMQRQIDTLEDIDFYEIALSIYNNCIMSDLYNNKNEIPDDSLTLFYRCYNEVFDVVEKDIHNILESCVESFFNGEGSPRNLAVTCIVDAIKIRFWFEERTKIIQR